MTSWLIVWRLISFDCPWGLGKAPEAVKALLCTKSEQYEWVRTAHRDTMIRTVREAGGDPLVLEILGPRTDRRRVEWEPVIR